jgi:alkylation response protein AidB-like acyl-CoA dehydrogenase
VFGWPIGQNQDIQFPIAKAYASVRAAELMVREALRLYEAGQNPRAEANMAKMLAADASFEAANACIQTHGGFGPSGVKRGKRGQTRKSAQNGVIDSFNRIEGERARTRRSHFRMAKCMRPTNYASLRSYSATNLSNSSSWSGGVAASDRTPWTR